MPIKYFCDDCGKELPEPYCLYTTGKILCDNCLPKFIAENEKKWQENYKIQPLDKKDG